MRHLPQAKLDKLGARKARHQFTHETAKADHFVNYKTTSWDHAPWKPAAAPGMTASAWSGPRWPPAKRVVPSGGEHAGH